MTDLTAELIADMVLPLDVVISPDGRWVAYGVTPFSKREEHPTSAVWLVALAGSSPPRQLTAGQANDTSPRWSPDGQSLAFLSDRATRGTAQLYVIAIDGGEARPLTPTKNKRPVLGFKWSPDGQTIAFWSADEPTEDDERREKEKDDPQVFGERWQHARLRLVNVASGEVKTLVSQDRHVVQAAWSPNGVEIAYLTWQTPWLEFAGRGVICECVNVTTGATRLVCQSARLGNPVWSADGHTLLFFAPVSAPSQSSNAVWAVAATGGELRRLALGETSCGGGLKPAVGSQRTVVSIAEGLHTHLAWLDPITGQTDVFWSTAEADSVCDLGWWSVFHQADGSIGVAATRSSGAQPWEVWTSQTAGWPNPAGGVEAMLPLDMPSSGLAADDIPKGGYALSAASEEHDAPVGYAIQRAVDGIPKGGYALSAASGEHGAPVGYAIPRAVDGISTASGEHGAPVGYAIPRAADDISAASEEHDAPVGYAIQRAAAGIPKGGYALSAASGEHDAPVGYAIQRAAAGISTASRGLTFTQLTHHQGALAEVRFGTQEPFYWRAPDGWEIDGILIRPPDAPPGPLPLVTLVHGGPYGRSALGMHMSWANWAQWLATAGYAILLPNYRGGYGHGDRFASAARGGVGEGDFPDVLSGVDAAIERGIADPNRLAIGGWSQGGFMTAWAITQTHRFKAAIMGAGVSDWGMMVLTTDVPDFERELGGSAPWDGVGPHRHAQLSPISFARWAKTPTLILHGQNDARVPVTQAIGFHRALRDVNCPSELVIYPREPHGIAERAHQLDVLRRVRAWCDRWLT